MVRDSSYTNIHRLKIRLINENILSYRCGSCGNEGMWSGSPLTLQLDHINGNPKDHRKENLRFLCPNCHSQTNTFAGKNINSRRVL
jgi:5-methylcytosine-specific restriction endonuclease McrA